MEGQIFQSASDTDWVINDFSYVQPLAIFQNDKNNWQVWITQADQEVAGLIWTAGLHPDVATPQTALTAVESLPSWMPSGMDTYPWPGCF